jgi:hypothetical protein
MFLLVDLSQRDIRVRWNGWVEILPFIDLERNFPTKIYKIFERFPDIQDIIVINGPGSFTTLRIGCLCLNIIQLWRKKNLRFHSITKKELFEHAYRQGFLPATGLMWIGQAKNAWELDLQHDSFEKILIEIWATHVWEEYFFDESLWVEQNVVTISCNERIYMSYKDQQLDIYDLCFQKKSEFVSPEYLVELTS